MRIAVLLLVAAGCSPAVLVKPAPPPVVAVVPPAPAPPEDPSIEARADEAERTTAERLRATASACGSDWLEPGEVCKPESFRAAATDYQAYYADHANPRAENARIDSLDRLGGPTSNVDQMIGDVARLCEDRCRAARLETISTAVDGAIADCEKARSGFASCKALEKKLSAHVRTEEADNWVGKCKDDCQATRDEARREALIDAHRPRTKAAVAACERACQKEHGGSWCGTDLIGCLGQCVPPAGVIPK